MRIWLSMILNNHSTARMPEIVKEWIREKQRNTYVRINEDWRGCDFLYPGWIK